MSAQWPTSSRSRSTRMIGRVDLARRARRGVASPPSRPVQSETWTYGPVLLPLREALAQFGDDLVGVVGEVDDLDEDRAEQRRRDEFFFLA